MKSFFLAKRGLAETTMSGGLLLPQLLLKALPRETLATGEVEVEEALPPLEEEEVALATGEAEALATIDAD